MVTHVNTVILSGIFGNWAQILFILLGKRLKNMINFTLN